MRFAVAPHQKNIVYQDKKSMNLPLDKYVKFTSSINKDANLMGNL